MKAIYMCLLFLVTPIALADGNALLKQCNDAAQTVDKTATGKDLVERTYNTGFCIGLMEGITQTNTVYVLTKRSEMPLMCLPEGGIKNGQAVRIVIKFLNEHPEDLHLDGGLLATMALHEAFPCKKITR